MKISGFSFIKDALIYDYPIVEAIKSILPICDEFVVAVGESRDNTLGLIKAIDKAKIKIVETVWDENLREGGKVLAIETDKAFSKIAKDSDWAFYIQGDEVVHEKYLSTIYDEMLKNKNKKNIDGLLFKYLHFYGSYDYIGSSSSWYQNEIRIIKNDESIYSYNDAQGFRKGNNKKLRVRPINAYIHHYGWVREPAAMQRKQENFNKYWHDDKWIDENILKLKEFDYAQQVKELCLFTGEHPQVMMNRIKDKNWQFDYDISYSNKNLKDRFKNFLNNKFGINIGYQNYILDKS